MEIRYYRNYERHGQLAPEKVLENEVWIDVGNDLREGVYDCHQTGGEASALAAVVGHGEYLSTVKDYVAACEARNQIPEILFHIHVRPDLDCFAGMYAVIKMFERGAAGPAEAFRAETLGMMLDYVNQIDNGKKKILSEPTLYAYLIGLEAEVPEGSDKTEIICEESLRALGLVEEALNRRGQEIDLFRMPLENYIDVSGLGYYDAVKQGIAREAAFYLEDKKNDIVTFRKVEVLNRVTGKMDMVKAALWMQPSSGVNGYVFARETDDCMLTVRPVCVRGVDGSPITRAIIALNPNLPGAEDLTLLPLAEILEQWEQLEEEEEYRKSGGYRRDHSHARENIGYFARVPFSETSDPWYISKVGDLIDAPHLGSLIAYDVILSIIRNASAMAHRVDVLRFLEEEGGKVVPVRADASEQISFGDLYEWAGKATDPPEALPNQIHLLIRVKVDQAMLRRHNRLLAACCLNMVGKSDSVMSRNSILEMDYRTCLYTDQAITILVAADTENAALEELVGADILQSRLCLDLQNLLEQRQELRDIGSGLSEKIQTIGHDTTEIDRFNARIVRLSTRIERDELITDSLELMVYSFIRNMMGIQTLKKSVIASAQLLIKNAEQESDRETKQAREALEEARKREEESAQRRDARIQAGIGWVTVLAVFSAWIDAYDFIGKLSPDMDDGWRALMNYPTLFWFEILMACAILVVGIVAMIYVAKAWQDTFDSGSSQEEADPAKGDSAQDVFGQKQ